MLPAYAGANADVDDGFFPILDRFSLGGRWGFKPPVGVASSFTVIDVGTLREPARPSSLSFRGFGGSTGSAVTAHNQ